MIISKFKQKHKNIDENIFLLILYTFSLQPSREWIFKIFIVFFLAGARLKKVKKWGAKSVEVLNEYIVWFGFFA